MSGWRSAFVGAAMVVVPGMGFGASPVSPASANREDPTPIVCKVVLLQNHRAGKRTWLRGRIVVERVDRRGTTQTDVRKFQVPVDAGRSAILRFTELRDVVGSLEVSGDRDLRPDSVVVLHSAHDPRVREEIPVSYRRVFSPLGGRRNVVRVELPDRMPDDIAAAQEELRTQVRTQFGFAHTSYTQTLSFQFEDADEFARRGRPLVAYSFENDFGRSSRARFLHGADDPERVAPALDALVYALTGKLPTESGLVVQYWRRGTQRGDTDFSVETHDVASGLSVGFRMSSILNTDDPLRGVNWRSPGELEARLRQIRDQESP